jgi:Cu+-exporting ATPase
MHLIAVSGDLGQFQHIHPAPTGAPGRFEISATFPSAGSYILFGEAQRAGGENVVKRHDLTVGSPSGAPAAARLADDSSLKTVGNVRVSVSGAEGIRARREATLTFRLENAQTGQPLADLQPYLGAPAHAVILSEDTTWFAHTHGEAVGAASADSHAAGGHGAGGHAAAPSGFGPEIAVRHTFRVPGLYKVWAQFQSASGEVITADYVVRAAQ